MAAWSDGYFTDVQYTNNFYRHLAPGMLSFACLRQGVRPPVLGAGSTYLELGCGRGFSLNVLAASDPAISFRGIDFNPAQIANAQRLAHAGGLANIGFEDLSFRQVLDLPEGRIPQCDVIALHGVYSWVNGENRALIVRILDRYLKPGGLVTISYNALPAWEGLGPLRRFVKAHFDRTTGHPLARAPAAFRAAQDLIERGASGFGPKAPPMIKRALREDPAYLIHEYLNDHFHPHYHADVARDLAAARLTFAASASFAEDAPALAAPPNLQDLIREETDPVWRETLLDYAADRLFRRDVFVRGRDELGPAELDHLLRQVRFNLIRPPGDISLDFQIPLGALKGDPETYGAVVAALKDGPRSYDELARAPPFTAADGILLKVLGLLIEAGAVHPTNEDAGGADAAKTFNDVLLDRFRLGEAPTHLAAPAARTGVRVRFTDLLGLSAVRDAEPDHAATARRGLEMIRGAGSLQKDGQPPQDPAAQEADLVLRLKAFEAESLPLFRRLGVI